MRISTLWAQNDAVSGILNQESALSDLQSKIATGKRVNQPSDDPVAAARIVSLQQNISTLEDYKKSAEIAKSNLELEESTLNSFSNIVQKIREKAIYANNGSLSLNDRQALAVEMQQLLSEMQGLANTQDSEGNYIFSGYMANNAPVVLQGNGQYVYAGDQGTRYTNISSVTEVANNDNGEAIFFDIDAADLILTTSATFGNLGTGSVGSFFVETAPPVVPESYVVFFNVPDPNPNFSIFDPSDLITPIAGFANIEYVPDQEYQINGIGFTITGTPSPTDTFNLSVIQQEKQNIFNATQNLIDSILSFGDDEERLSYNVGVALTNLSNAQDSILTTRAMIGSRLNTIDTEISANTDYMIISKTALSYLEDLDLTVAITDLELISVALQAAQQSFVRIRDLSIFNYF